MRMILSGGGRGWILKVSHFEMDAKASRERSSSQTGLLQSQPSPRHYGNPFLVRVTAEETVGVLLLLLPNYIIYDTLLPRPFVSILCGAARVLVLGVCARNLPVTLC